MDNDADKSQQAAEEKYEDLSSDERSAQYERLQSEYHSHPGFLAHRKWTELGRSKAIWTRNTNELLGLLEALMTREELKIEMIQNVHSQTARDMIMGQLDQRLHNMLAAATSLVDQTRRHMSAYTESPFATEFEAFNKIVATAPAAAFLRRLRNYLLHIGNAPFNLHAQFPTAHTDFDTIQLDIRLDPGTLLGWNGWNEASKAYIAGFPDGVPLPDTIRTYAEMMRELYQWVMEQFEALHGDDIDGMNDLIRRINLTMTAGSWDGREPERRYAILEENIRRHKRGEPQLDARTGEEIAE